MSAQLLLQARRSLQDFLNHFELNDHAWCCARPSGTEPKIKFYMGVKGTGLEDADKKLEELTDAVSEIVGL